MTWREGRWGVPIVRYATAQRECDCVSVFLQKCVRILVKKKTHALARIVYQNVHGHVQRNDAWRGAYALS